MQFAPQQDEALKAVSRWLKEGRQPVFRLFGYAGTGKTTLARHFAEHVDGDVLFAAFTGKAAQVLRSRGATNAKTIHSLIYRPRGEEEVEDEETGKTSIAPMFSINRQSPLAKAALIVIDECSMVDEQLGRDLMSFGTPILVLGDPGQLPPVSGGGFFTNQEPDFLLTEIHRQARDNPIITVAMDVREGKELMYGDYGTVQIIGRSDVNQDMVLSADQVLVGTNKTRRRYNQRLRQLKGFTSEYPQSGDKLVCLRNDPAKGLLNGSLWQVMSSSRETVKPGINLMIRPEDDDMDRGAAKIKLLKAAFEESDTEIPWTTRKRYDEFDYGYALTVHKAQGSQWNKVVLFDESWAFRDSRERWLYTAITRAAKELIIVR
ncbi:ATP-dependent DNA helicase [Gellertiella hungarica]|uniref:Exodeoxyribonuclease-5 n=1 Tax=Gellertiella hungarica TaxID=1572859 RepID=A0A7W6J2P0_9HYPH|nr:ATP-dependent RecD-like DNA helicase [Gellertiella hungarica]MBB4063612.1 exodeoxyribonuclease-5 [Gellertiella hungarica]